MAAAKHHRQKRNRKSAKDPDGHGQRARTRPTASGSQGSTSYHPRDQYRPANITDAVDRHVSRATETEDALQRYLRLLRFTRSTTLLIFLVTFVPGVIFAAGIAMAVAYAGLRPMEALGVGLGGSAASILTVVLAVSRWLRVGVDTLARAGQAAREALEEKDEIAD